MTDKTALVNALTEKGYDVEISDGVVMVMLEREKFKNRDVNSDIKKLIDTMEYDGSWGLKVKAL